jgi:predicted TIM-barrel fold metal-dependent hydrolase
MPRRIDCHVHAYPAAVAQDPRAWAESRGEPWWADCVAPRERVSIQGWADADQMIRDMDAAGIDVAIMLGWYWQHQSTCDEQNTWMAAWQKRHPDRLRAFAAVNASAGADAIASTRRCLNEGFLGIGELLDSVQGYRYADDSFLELAALAREFDAPFNLHVTDPKLDAKPGMQPTPLQDFTQLAAKLPDNNFILAHLGGGLAWRDDAPLPPNLYFDTAAVPLIYEHDCYRQAIAAAGLDRILFGTDYPLRVFPRLDKPPGFQRMVGEIEHLDLPEEELSAMFGENLQKLLPRV